MKKQFSLLLVGAAFLLQAQTGNVGINTTSPTANFHLKGDLRLEHPSQAQEYILMSDENGGGTWVSRNSIKNYITGTLPTTTIVSPDTTSRYSGVKITLPKGYFLVNVNILLETAEKIADGKAIWVRTTFSDSATNSTLTTDITPNTATQMSGGMVGPTTYGMLQGAVLIKNTTIAPKTYYLWVTKESINSTTNSLIKFAQSTNVDENSIYALRIQ